MTDEQIIKSLNYFAYGNKGGCEQCGFHSGTEIYVTLLMRNVIELINRQKEEINELRKENKILSINADTAFQDGLNENRDLFKKEVEAEIKVEVIKEFAKRLCNHRVANDPVMIAVNVELKQMTEVSDENL